jgi:soluble lytic murein transglycosylase-like protein
VRGFLLLCACALAGLAETPQEASIARQREAIEKQRAALEAQSGATQAQRGSIEKQKASAEKQPRRTAPEPAAVAPPPTGPSLAWMLPESGCGSLAGDKLDETITRAATANELAPELIRAVIQRESAFQPCAVSSAGAMGLMQLMPATAQGLNVSDPFDPEENILAGTRFLRQMLDRFGGNVSLALGAYNAGPARVEASGGIPPIPETKAYVQDILSRIR